MCRRPYTYAKSLPTCPWPFVASLPKARARCSPALYSATRARTDSQRPQLTRHVGALGRPADANLADSGPGAPGLGHAEHSLGADRERVHLWLQRPPGAPCHATTPAGWRIRVRHPVMTRMQRGEATSSPRLLPLSRTPPHVPRRWRAGPGRPSGLRTSARCSVSRQKPCARAGHFPRGPWRTVCTGPCFAREDGACAWTAGFQGLICRTEGGHDGRDQS